MCAHPISPGNMLASSKTAHDDWQLMRSKSELQKALHASTRNRQLKIPPMPATRLKPMVVCACDNPNRWGCPGTMQGIVMGAVQMQTQGLHNCTNLYNGDNTTIHRHGLPDGLQASSYGARKVPGTTPDRESIIKVVKQDCVEKRPNRTSSQPVPKFKSPPPPKNLQNPVTSVTYISFV